MKKTIILIPFLLFFYLKQELIIISYNIRYDNPGDGKNIWDNRKNTILKFIKYKNPDFIGLQEVTHNQLIFLDNQLKTYDYVGVGRDDGKNKGEFSPILYDSKKFKLITSKTIWLSESPNKISIGWDAAMERICTYGLFENLINKTKIWVFNTHFDHVGNDARKKSTELIIETIKKNNSEDFPVILTGDLNLGDQNPSIKKLQNFLIDSMKHLSSNSDLYGTFNGFQENTANRRIDYVFYKNLKIINSNHIHLKTPFGGWASDHHPVITKFKF